MAIYQPSEDSYLLQEESIKYLKNIKNKNISILDMGSGSGIQAKTCRKLGFKNIIAVDISSEAIKHLRKQGFKSIQTNLFSNLKKQKFNLIIFNPPYLPEDKYDKKRDTTAGKKGYELIVEFLRQAKSHLDNKGEILLLCSSLSKPKIIRQKAREMDYKIKILNKKNLFFERLYVYLLKI